MRERERGRQYPTVRSNEPWRRKNIMIYFFFLIILSWHIFLLDIFETFSFFEMIRKTSTIAIRRTRRQHWNEEKDKDKFHVNRWMLFAGSLGADRPLTPVRGSFWSVTEPRWESVNFRLTGRRFCLIFESRRRSSNSCDDARLNLVRKHNGIRSWQCSRRSAIWWISLLKKKKKKSNERRYIIQFDWFLLTRKRLFVNP